MTPYKRLLADGNISIEAKARLTKTYLSVNPAALKRGMIKLFGNLEKMAMPS
jgi:hypothetical protein